MIGLVAGEVHHGKLFLLLQRLDLLEHLGARHLEGQRVDDDLAVLDLVGGARLEAAVARLVHLHQLIARRDDFRPSGQIRAFDVRHDFARAQVRIVQQRDAGLDHFAQVMRRDVGRHADGDA